MSRIGTQNAIAGTLSGLAAGASAEAATMAISNATVWAASVTLIIAYERVDKMVIMKMPGFTATLAAPNPSSIVFAGTLPASLRPNEAVTTGSVMVWTAGARSNTVAKLQVDTAGVVTLFRTLDQTGAFTGGAGGGFDAHTINYVVP